MNKRLVKEIQRLTIEQNSRPLLENDYLIYVNDENMNKVYTIIKPPYDSVYRHKFIRLDFDIPNEYPYHPPKVTFVNYDYVRIHPNFYEDGRCCSTILNSWPSAESDGIKLEAWSSSMGIETILLTFRSFLDNNPYTHEPGGRDDISYTNYVLYQTWDTCLLKYINKYTNSCQPKLFLDYINKYIMGNIEYIYNDLHILRDYFPCGIYHTPCFYIYEYSINYDTILICLEEYITTLKKEEPLSIQENTSSQEHQYNENNKNEDYNDINFFVNNNNVENNLSTIANTIINNESSNNEKDLQNKNVFKQQNEKEEIIKCQICFDQIYDESSSNSLNLVILECQHCFHRDCIKRHILHNGQLCSFCRCKTSFDEWLINPQTNKKIKIDGITYKKIIQNGVNI